MLYLNALEALQRASSRPHHIQAAFTPEQAERLREILHTSPREFDKPTRVWILELADRVCAAFGCDHEDHFAVPENAS